MGLWQRTLIILVLLFDGTLVQERYELGREMPVSECLQYGDDHREAIAEYKEFQNNLKNGWYSKGWTWNYSRPYV